MEYYPPLCPQDVDKIMLKKYEPVNNKGLYSYSNFKPLLLDTIPVKLPLGYVPAACRVCRRF